MRRQAECGDRSSLGRTGAVVAALAVTVLMVAGCGVGPDEIMDPPGRYKIQDREFTAVTLAEKMREIDEQYAEPRTPARVALSLETARAYESRTNEYDALWRSVRACAWLARNHPDPDERDRYGRLGVQIGQIAKDQKELSRRVETHYYLALAIGAFCEVLHEGGQIPTVEWLQLAKYHAKTAAGLDDAFDHAGAYRFLGRLIVEASSTITHEIGSFEEGVEYLERAVRIAPDFGENRLFLAEAYLEDGRFDAARVEVGRVIESPVPRDHSVEHRDWLHAAEKLLRQLPQEGTETSSVEVTAYEFDEGDPPKE